MFEGLFAKILLSLVCGAVIGLEREGGKRSVGSIGGIRTYSLVALLGSVAGILALNQFASFAYFTFAALLIILGAYYVVATLATHDFGITSELSVVMTFLIGLLLTLAIVPVQIIVALFVLVVLVLSLKSTTAKIAAGVTRQELGSFISFAIIALVVLPFLPDIHYKLADIPFLSEIVRALHWNLGNFESLDLINPRKIWFVVVLITGIDVSGYILSKLVGSKKSFALTSFVAGFVSSTSATQSLAQKSKKSKYVSHLVGAAALANLASFLQIFLLVSPLNARWLLYIAPSIVLMVIAAGAAAFVLFKRKETDTQQENQEIQSEQVFSLMPALKFACLLVVIKIVTKACLILFGNSAFVISSVIASFTGLDAILVNLAEMAGATISFKFALLTFLLVNATNLVSKTVYSYLQGSRNFALKFLAVAACVVIAGSAWILMV